LIFAGKEIIGRVTSYHSLASLSGGCSYSLLGRAWAS